MMLSDLLAQPHPSYKQIQHSPLTEENCPDLSLEWNGRNLTQRETFCLLTHVVVTDQRAILPEAWLDPLALGILEIADRSSSPWATAFFGGAAPKIAGPRALDELADRVRTGRALPQTLPHLLEPLLARDWRSAVPFFTEALLATRRLNGYFKSHVEERLEKVRVQLGVSPEIWELLSIPESHLAPERIAKTRRVWAAKLEEFMQRELRMSAKEFRLLTEHPVHGDNLRGLVVRVHSQDSTLEAWPFQLGDDDLISIVHPLLVEPRERDEWKARMTSEGRVAPFDQWKDAGKTPRLDLDGLAANPSELMLHLEARGWRRGRTGVDGMIRSHSKRFPDIQLLAVVQYNGIPATYGGRWSRQTITGCAFENESTGSSVETERVSPIVVSVVMEDLAGLKT